MVRIIRSFLDLFYPLVSKIFDKTTYYYAVAGSTNLVLGWVLFWVLDHWVIHSNTINIPFVNHPIHSYTPIAATCGVFSFLFGFLMMRYVVFTESQLKGRVQFFRYGLSALIFFASRITNCTRTRTLLCVSGKITNRDTFCSLV